MLKYFFAFVVLVHGLIHLMGFAKASGLGNITQLTKEISKPVGILWLVAAMLFIAATTMYLLKDQSWVFITIVAVILSQVLIIGTWKDAKFGSLANIVILIIAIAGWASHNFERNYRNDVKAGLLRTNKIQGGMLTEFDLQSLPLPVQKYMRYCGVIGKPKVSNMRIVFDGQMRDKGKAWFTFTSEQFNFFDEPTRLFFMKAKMFGITVPSYHHYEVANATMQIKLFGLFNVVNVKGAEMNQAETVTVFNDMCLMAPAALIDKRVIWTSIDSLSVKASFTIGVNKISAVLYFNEKGQLINFTSDDRYAIDDMKQYRFSTPVKDYMQINERNIWKYGETVWHYPDGKFVYGKFTLKSIEYNVANFQ